MAGNELKADRAHRRLGKAEQILIGRDRHHRLRGQSVDLQIRGVDTPHRLIEEHLNRTQRLYDSPFGWQDPRDPGRLGIHVGFQFRIEDQIAAGQGRVERLDRQYIGSGLEHFLGQGHCVVSKIDRLGRRQRGEGSESNFTLRRSEAGHFTPVDPGDETVVHLHPQNQASNIRR